MIPGKKNINEIAVICKDLDVVINDIVVNSPDGSIGGFLTKPEKRLNPLPSKDISAFRTKSDESFTFNGIGELAT